jgi:HSP20 family protein
MPDKLPFCHKIQVKSALLRGWHLDCNLQMNLISNRMSTENPNDDLFQNLRDGFEGISKRVSSFVDDVMSGEGTGTELRVRTDVYETSDHYVIEVEIPGVQKEDVKIQVQDSVLHIRGQKRPPEGAVEFVYDRRERRFGTFMKAIPLPAGIQLENIKAKYESGLLLVRFPQQISSKSDDNSIDID